VRIAAYFVMIVGLGGLEPPTSPLSDLFQCLHSSRLANRVDSFGGGMLVEK
jgi:hypothetical protein